MQQHKGIHSFKLSIELPEASTAGLVHAAGLAGVGKSLQCRKYTELFCVACLHTSYIVRMFSQQFCIS